MTMENKKRHGKLTQLQTAAAGRGAARGAAVPSPAGQRPSAHSSCPGPAPLPAERRTCLPRAHGAAEELPRPDLRDRAASTGGRSGSGPASPSP